jgi:hypothetical protein
LSLSAAYNLAEIFVLAQTPKVSKLKKQKKRKEKKRKEKKRKEKEV